MPRRHSRLSQPRREADASLPVPSESLSSLEKPDPGPTAPTKKPRWSGQYSPLSSLLPKEERPCRGALESYILGSLSGVYGDPVRLNDVANVPIRAHGPVVAVVLDAGLQGDHVPAGLGSRDPRVRRRHLYEPRNLVGV